MGEGHESRRNRRAVSELAETAMPLLEQKGPLAGIRVIDLTQVLLGPYATQALAQLGAEVVKVEPPGGDNRRSLGPSRNPGMSSQFLNINRGKRSIAIDLKQPRGREVLLALCKNADVLVHNNRRAAMARLGLSYQDIAEVNPRIVYCGAVGFGEAGPYADKPAYDDMIQGLAAVPALQERLTGKARYAPFNLSDRICGMVFTQAILAALLCRERTGIGQAVEVPMYEAMAEFVLSEHIGGHIFAPPVDGMGSARQFERKPSPTRDGYLCFWIGTDAQCAKLFDAIGLFELTRDPRFAARANRNRNLGDFYAAVNAVLATKTTAEWMRVFEAHDIPVMPMHSLESLLEDPHLNAVGFLTHAEHPTEGCLVNTGHTSNWSRTQPPDPAPAPRLGEHTVAILTEAGFDPADIKSLVDASVVVAAQ